MQSKLVRSRWNQMWRMTCAVMLASPLLILGMSVAWGGDDPYDDLPRIRPAASATATPQVTYFFGDPPSLSAASRVTLVYDAINVTTCQLTGGGLSLPVPVHGLSVVTVAATTRFDLACTGPNGPASANTTILVGSAPPTTPPPTTPRPPSTPPPPADPCTPETPMGAMTVGPCDPQPGLCTPGGANNEPEILAGYLPGDNQTVGATGQIKVWVTDEWPEFIAPGEQLAAATGKITTPGDRVAKMPDGYLREPALYFTPFAEGGAPPHFPQYVKGDYNNTTTKGTVFKSAPIETPPPGTQLSEKYDTEVIWDVAALGLAPGTYVAEFVIHDGDKDLGVGCVTIVIVGPSQPPTTPPTVPPTNPPPTTPPPPGSNQPPKVNAGPDFTVPFPPWAGKTQPTVSDDGKPNPPGQLILTWTKVSGPGAVTFSDPRIARTDVLFGAPGVYVLRLTASDGAASAYDDVQVTVGGGGTLPPTMPPPTSPPPTTPPPPSSGRPPSVMFVAMPSVINAGQSSVLQWLSLQATTCQASNGWQGAKALSGKETVTPSQTTTYTIACQGPGGSTTQSRTVTVRGTSPAPPVTPPPTTPPPGTPPTTPPAPPTVPPPASPPGTPPPPSAGSPHVVLFPYPSTIDAGQSSTLYWFTLRASACTASGGWQGARATSGKESMNPPTTTSYTLTCTGPGGQDAKTATVTIRGSGPAPQPPSPPGSPPPSTKPPISDDQLLGYWPFDEGTGTTSADASGHGRTAQLKAGAGWGTGRLGQALRVGGRKEFAEVPSGSALLIGQQFSLAWWLNSEKVDADERWLAEPKAWDIKLNEGYPQLSTRSGYNQLDYQLHDSQWQHLAVTYDNGRVLWYVNGQRRASRVNKLKQAVAKPPADHGLLFGTDGQNFAKGRIDEVWLFGRVLSDDEVKRLYDSPGASPTPPSPPGAPTPPAPPGPGQPPSPPAPPAGGCDPSRGMACPPPKTAPPPTARPPLVQLIQPQQGQTFASPATIDMTATELPASGGGPILRVEFYAGTTKLGQASSRPLTFRWASVGPGDYMLTAKAFGEQNLTAVSAPVLVHVVTKPTGPPGTPPTVPPPVTPPPTIPPPTTPPPPQPGQPPTVPPPPVDPCAPDIPLGAMSEDDPARQPAPCNTPPLCTEGGANNESEILAAYQPGNNQTVGATGQIKVWVTDEWPEFIAPGEKLDPATGKITAPGDRVAKMPDGYLREPALYIAPNFADNGGTPHFPQSIRGDYNNTTTKGTVFKSAPIETPPPGTQLSEKYNTEVIWDVAALGLAPGTYIAQFVIHDGDKDLGVGCITIVIQ